MNFTAEEKMARLQSKGWIFQRFTDAAGTPKINARFYEPIGRTGRKRNVPLYNLYFRNRNDLVRELYYSSIGTQRELAKEFGLSAVEVSYIKNGSRTYVRKSKDGTSVRVKVDAGKAVKCTDDIRFHLSQIQNRPYSIFLRRESMERGAWTKKIDTICKLLTRRTGVHYFAEYTQMGQRDGMCTIYVDDIYPIYHAPAAEYHDAFSYLNSLFSLTNAVGSAEQREIIGMITNI